MVDPGYTKPPPEVGRLNVLQACSAEGSGGGGRWGLGGVWGGGWAGFGGLATRAGGGGAKGPPPFYWSPTGVWPTACTLA